MAWADRGERERTGGVRYQQLVQHRVAEPFADAGEEAVGEVVQAREAAVGAVAGAARDVAAQ